MTNQHDKPDEKNALFMQLYVPNQHRILGYLLTLVGDRNVADDLLQETAVTLFARFDSFELGTDFVAWACQVAFWKVKNYRRSLARSKLLFSDDFIDKLSERTVEIVPTLDARRQALDACLKRLDERDHEFLMARYQPGGSVARAAQVAGRTTQAAYKSLQRLRRVLRDCVSLRLSTES
ncbi:sigma-70 family RNA polymerase sigma factor [Bythopirellula polymerisocia]|uniref:RNA polymerase sigma factor RpoE n=1 Tax=Bythopirellula polymerisocia TaxID=2528003 RepID=A0A5C6CXV6_9BACT|nr:sigma-70 family RNA polymerase sigma factor [Bythopirellula polymerisocia]TWU28377.1 RNA polymerase sigma factor RpoE [Bythopirellula polymerisocia]